MQYEEVVKNILKLPGINKISEYHMNSEFYEYSEDLHF